MLITSSTMKKTLNDFFADTDFEVNARQFLEESLEKLLNDKLFVSVVSQYQEGTLDRQVAIDACPEIALSSGVHEYTVALLLLIAFTKRLKELYKLKGISQDIYITTVSDLKYKAMECFATKKVYGTFVFYWLYKYFELGRFGIGRLQFEIVKFPVEYKSLTRESDVIKIHIPGSGEPLSSQSIDSSIERARAFFGTDLPSPLPVICSSWLLYPGYEGLFKSGSNIDLFRKRFELVQSTDDTADDYPDMWRLFNMDYTGNVDDYPENSSLHKSFKAYLKNGGKTGTGLGIFYVK